MGLIFDTTELIRLERDAGIIQELISEAGDVPFGISIITVSELLHGVERAASNAVRVRRQAFVEGVLDQFPILPFDMPAARVHARIWASLAAQGEMIGAHDLIIAATAISLDYEVVTSTMRDFTKVDGLRVRKG
ncbi:MAG TPA: PIN domain-containing protein [Deltaproteobacteria bacterium]|nr:PIN domain-containing protein [Deltaproteobacteria bacterium]HNS91192.1 PIN domain-containing protein [Deltaproteobacteria bacterium]HOD72917.1 PIN domain-containing protein [Deltaproteobacteria bacterium]HOG84674.1 PIN domain-containing protein [Deltaproteobacteria bacterium]HPE46267.1 PIN domain-containing protein [Deltaproteobacteria bacterium]